LQHNTQRKKQERPEKHGERKPETTMPSKDSSRRIEHVKRTSSSILGLVRAVVQWKDATTQYRSSSAVALDAEP
jgi:hypothetical protein